MVLEKSKEQNEHDVHSLFATANFQDLASSHEQILLERFMFLRLLYQERRLHAVFSVKSDS